MTAEKSRVVQPEQTTVASQWLSLLGKHATTEELLEAVFFCKYFSFPCQFSFHRLLHTHNLSSRAGTIGQLVVNVPSRLSHPTKRKRKHGWECERPSFTPTQNNSQTYNFVHFNRYCPSNHTWKHATLGGSTNPWLSAWIMIITPTDKKKHHLLIQPW
jgi:hypothetical protein